MYFFNKLNITLIILFTFITFAQAETSWITKKKDKDKTEKVTKIVEKKSSEWIKKKEVKENKKKLKEKLKDSKSWITKKSKDKVKDIKNKLKKHKTIDNLPKAEFYFAAKIEPLDDEDPQYIYGYVNSNKKSDTFIFKDQSYYSKSDGIAYFENKKNRCQVDVKITPKSYSLSGDVVLECRKNKKMAGGFIQMGSVGEGIGEHWNGNRVKFQFYTKKIDAIAKLENYKSSNTQFAHSPQPSTNQMVIEPTGKYYALLIGNSNYAKWTKLNSPINDVTAIEKVLKSQYNFEKIIKVIDGTQKKIFKAFYELSKISTDNDYVLIYYAGHGDIVNNNQSFWIPVDAEAEFGFGDWINIREIEVYLEEKIPAHHLAVMVDSCYFTTSKGSENYSQETLMLEKYLEKRARIVLASGTNQPVDDTNKGEHSLFGYTFIKSLEDNKTAINLLAIRDNLILAHSNQRQQPFGHGMKHWGHNGGDFVFVVKK